MKKRNFKSLLTIALAAVCCSCASDDSSDNYSDSASGDSSGKGSSFVSDQTPTLTGDVLSFSIAFDESEAATYSQYGETVPTDETNAAYEDYVENFSEQYSITINYDGSSATAEGDTDVLTDLTIDGADVSVTSSTAGVTYTLTGSSTNGSFKMVNGDDDKKFGLVLKGLTLAKSGGSAINIQPSKRCYLQIEGTNTLSNSGSYSGSDEDQKGCIFSEGKLLISGEGTLDVSSVKMHAIASDDYVWIHSGPTINLKTYSKDGIHANDSVVVSGGMTYIDSYGDGIQVDETTGNYVQTGGFVQIYASCGDEDDENSHGVKSAGSVILSGGALQVSVSDLAAKAVKADGDITVTGGHQTLITSGDGTTETDESTGSVTDTKGSAGLAADGNITLSGGTIDCLSTGSAGKGIKAEGTLTTNDGCTVRVMTKGKRYSYSSSLHSSPKGIKADGKMTINGGTIVVKLTGSGDGTEAIEGKDAITINDGFIAASCYDDAINSALEMTINGGYLYAQASNNDGIDANRNIYINGGVVLASGASQPENAIDAAEGYNIYINGGWVFGVGGSTSQTASGSQQASIAYTANVSGRALALSDASGNPMMYVSVPSTSCTACFMTASGMTAGSTYVVTSGASVSGGTTWCGLNVTGSISTGSSLASATAAASVGEGMGGGMGTGGGMGPGGR